MDEEVKEKELKPIKVKQKKGREVSEKQNKEDQELILLKSACESLNAITSESKIEVKKRSEYELFADSVGLQIVSLLDSCSRKKASLVKLKILTAINALEEEYGLEDQSEH